MAYLPREERRAAIVAAALRVMQRDGFGAVTARSVALDLGGSPGLIHQHFPSVQGLISATWRSYVSENLAEFHAALTGGGGDPIAEFFANHVDPARGSELGLWADAWGHAQRESEFAAVFSESVDELASTLHEAAPSLSRAEADRAVLLAVALAGMNRVAPERYPQERIVEILEAS